MIKFFITAFITILVIFMLITFIAGLQLHLDKLKVDKKAPKRLIIRKTDYTRGFLHTAGTHLYKTLSKDGGLWGFYLFAHINNGTESEYLEFKEQVENNKREYTKGYKEYSEEFNGSNTVRNFPQNISAPIPLIFVEKDLAAMISVIDGTGVLSYENGGFILRTNKNEIVPIDPAAEEYERTTQMFDNYVNKICGSDVQKKHIVVCLNEKIDTKSIKKMIKAGQLSDIIFTTSYIDGLYVIDEVLRPLRDRNGIKELVSKDTAKKFFDNLYPAVDAQCKLSSSNWNWDD